ncbi:Putative zn(2)Cys(6) fungal-type DNA-binding domain, fungal transcription factor [Colletotrichum destructivum]|uniref:Zn(2)Cys(6) fungal-type DNA-binding domain, fungal transcription factor n=1 Tax=Colletotrichum destructivum TaxID=34406 RepID=A0AAX4IRX3_9PEZI|nr:Putative zn(2)Cys(6) fungal-type DNA-binding domain, fungal transcription factor [Colletotrichum destructivum]
MPRETASCWTCRLRHKKCDESMPVCNVCAGLEITCYPNQPTPDWIDGGTRQQAMADQLKTEVTRSAKLRRARRIVQRIVGSTQDIPGGMFPPSLSVVVSQEIPSRPISAISNETENPARNKTPSRRRSGTEPLPGTPTDRRSLIQKQPETESASPSATTLPTEVEQAYIMSYLDYMFPALFPFYNPSPLEGGRSWVLVLTLANKSLCHAATSLSSHFFAVVPVQRRKERPACVSLVEQELYSQTSTAMRKAQQDVKEVTRRGVHGDLITSVRLVDSIVHLLFLEVSLGSSENWIIHLDAGVNLFKDILDKQAIEIGSSKWTSVCKEVGRLAYPSLESPPLWPVWTVDQAAFRFSVAALVMQDLMASISLGRTPRLRVDYDDILADETVPEESPDRDCRLRLQSFIGCQNWAVVLIADVVMLDAWKRDMHDRGMLSNLELFKRGAELETRFRDGLARVSASEPRARDHRPPWLAEPERAEEEAKACVVVTQIWAQAGLIYLHIVLSGWQPANLEISESIDQIIGLMNKRAKAKWVHTLAWPLCVTGCLAKREQETTVQRMFDLMGDFAMFGSTRLAREVVETVWEHRKHTTTENWDFAAILKILGRRVLLG